MCRRGHIRTVQEGVEMALEEGQEGVERVRSTPKGSKSVHATSALWAL